MLNSVIFCFILSKVSQSEKLEKYRVLARKLKKLWNIDASIISELVNIKQS